MMKRNELFIQELIGVISKKEDRYSAWIAGGLLVLYLMYSSLQPTGKKADAKCQTDEELVAELNAIINS